MALEVGPLGHELTGTQPVLYVSATKSPRHAYAATKRELNAAVLDLPQAAVDDFFARAMPHWTSPELKARLAAALDKKR